MPDHAVTHPYCFIITLPENPIALVLLLHVLQCQQLPLCIQLLQSCLSLFVILCKPEVCANSKFRMLAKLWWSKAAVL